MMQESIFKKCSLAQLRAMVLAGEQILECYRVRKTSNFRIADAISPRCVKFRLKIG